jgi:hypothetical protein
MSEARTGPPPEKRERRPVERTAHLENTGNWNGANNITDADNWSSDDDLLIPWDWGGYTGFAVVLSQHTKSLIAAGALAWIIVELFCIDDEKDWSAYPDLEFASQMATHIIIVPDLDEVHEFAGSLAAKGARVLLIERPKGAPLPPIGNST